MSVEAALTYAQKHGLHALVVERDGILESETYDGGYGPEKPHALYSGTKSFWGICAAAGQDDGLLSLDEPVSRTFAAWNATPRKRAVTLRMLLSLTSGMAFGGLGSSVPAFAAALEKDVRDEPGSTFTYGGVPLQVFGAVLARKLQSRGLTPQQYLQARILEPAEVTVGSWRTLKDGTQPLPTGASLTARSWLAYGRFILSDATAGRNAIVSAAGFRECFEGSSANAHYGLGWWLDPLDRGDGLAYASGSGGQALYVIPSRRMVAVHFGDSKSWRHETFLRRLLEA